MYTLIVIVAVVALFVFVAKHMFHGTHLSVVSHRQVDDEMELELSDGSVFRSKQGIIWYGFPSGVQTGSSLSIWLGDEWDRLSRLDKWSETRTR